MNRIIQCISSVIACCILFGCGDKPMSNRVIMENGKLKIGCDTLACDSFWATAPSPSQLVVAHTYERKADNLFTSNITDTIIYDIALDGTSSYSSPSNLIDVMYSHSVALLAYRNPEASNYSIILTDALLRPNTAMTWLKSQVRNGKIRQPEGLGGGWPVVADRITWAEAAWEVYLTTGSHDWLEYCYDVIKSTLNDDREVLYCRKNGLMHGAQPFISILGHSYPSWMEPKDIFESKNLSINILYARAYWIMELICDELGRPVESDLYHDWFTELKDAINQNLWNEDSGFYSEYLYGFGTERLSPGIDNNGQALAVIWGIADDERSEQLMRNSPINVVGVPRSYPSESVAISAIQPFWNMAAALTENETALRFGIGAMLLNFVAKMPATPSYEIPANLSLVLRVILGISPRATGLEFNPFVPECLEGTHTVTNLKYRKAVLDITLNGFGSEITSITLDGKALNEAFLPASIEGRHSVTINLARGVMSRQKVTLASNKSAFSLEKTEAVDSTQAAVYPIGKLTTISENTDISVTVKAESAGEYFADILYTNDEAQSIFGNQCAVRILLVNSHAQGAVVMPQRGPVNGTGYSNPQKISLLRGENKIQLKYIEPQCVNASLTKNSAFIHSLRIIKPR